jgi:hypothetical protein
MGFVFRSTISVLILPGLFVATSCSGKVEAPQNVAPPVAIVPPTVNPQPSPTPEVPNLQAELLDDRNKISAHGLGQFDFKNYTYDLPRGWENPDGSEIKLVNGRVAPVSVDVTDKMTNEEKADRKAQRRIGLSYVTTKFLDVTGDGEDEAIVVLKIETGGAAIPQVVYVFTWKDGKPELIWQFRTGDRADGGLKDIRSEGGLVVLELYGQDRFVLGQTETGKITGDEEQLCCPLYFTRSAYKWNGNAFLMQGKRLTFSIADRTAPPVENLGDKVNAPAKPKK